jgi:hypothetical protein
MQKDINKAYISHIVAAKEKGARGDKILSAQLEVDFNNLMLLCDECHNRIDEADPHAHPKEILLLMKKQHEERIELVTGISEEKRSHVVIYRANIGKHSPSITSSEANHFLLPSYHPAFPEAIDLSLSNSAQRDKDSSFWITELENLENQFNEQLRPRFRKGEIAHLSIFAFAPIPLLIKLGTLINNIHHANIHQPIKASQTWNLSDLGDEVIYVIKQPESISPVVALNISLSGKISDNRITSILGQNCTIYNLSIDLPFNDYLRTKKHLEDFSIAIRKLFNIIKTNHGRETTLNVFPAMPVSAAIEFGRCWMPKSDMPLCIYDENGVTGFIKTIEIN